MYSSLALISAVFIAVFVIGYGSCAPSSNLLIESRERPGGGNVHCTFGFLKYEITGREAINLMMNSSNSNPRTYMHQVAIGGKWNAVRPECLAVPVPRASHPSNAAKSMWEIVIAQTACDTQLDSTGNLPIYRNRAYLTMRTPRTSSQTGPYTETTVIVPFSCNAINESFAGGDVALAEMLEVLDDIEGIYAIPLSTYSSSIFRPIAEYLTNQQVMQLNVELHEDATEFVTSVERCWVTATDNPKDSEFVPVIEHGVPLDSYTELNQTATGAVIHLMTISFDENTERNYLHCQFNICWKSGSTDECAHRSRAVSTLRGLGVFGVDPYTVDSRFRFRITERPKRCYRNGSVGKCHWAKN